MIFATFEMFGPATLGGKQGINHVFQLQKNTISALYSEMTLYLVSGTYHPVDEVCWIVWVDKPRLDCILVTGAVCR